MIARKLAVLFGFNRDVRLFYAACCLDELIRGHVLRLLNASFGTAITQCHNPIFYAEINDHGVHRGDTGSILAQWRRPVASEVALALDLPYWVMHFAPCCMICMAIEMAREGGHFCLS